MATACLSEAPRATLPGRQEILDWYARLPRQGPAQILGVAAHAGPEALRAAFVSLARRFHPDVLAGEEADLREKSQAIFARVTEAYRSLVANQPRPQKRAATSAHASAPRGPQGACPREQEPKPQDALPTPAGVVRPRMASPGPAAAEPMGLGEQHRRVEEALTDAVASIAGGDGDAAVVRLHQVLTLADPRQRHRIRLVLARAYLVDSRNCRTGVSLLSDILRDDPRDAEALTLLGTFFRREGLLARAEVLLARAVLADPGNARARSDLREVRLALQRRREPAPTPGEGRGLVARLLSAR